MYTVTKNNVSEKNVTVDHDWDSSLKSDNGSVVEL